MAQLWFKFWAKDYLGDGKVGCLSYEKRGILQTLWAYAWEAGSIPADIDQLSELLKRSPKLMKRDISWILEFFHPNPENPSRLISPRLEQERLDADVRGSKARESALQRWSKRNANALPTDIRKPCRQDAGQGQGQKELPLKSPVEPSGAAPVREETKAVLTPIQQVLEFWDLVAVPAGLPEATRLSPKAQAALGARLKEPGWMEAFRAAVTYAATHPEAAWMRGNPGKDGRTWRCPLMHMLEPGNAEKHAASARAAARAPARASPRVTPLRPDLTSQGPSSFPPLPRAGTP